MKISEQMAKLRENIKLKQADIIQLTGDSISKNATPDEETETKIKSLQAEIEVMQTNYDRLDTIAKSQAKWEQATPVVATTPEQGAGSTQGNNIVVESNLEKGIGFALMAKALTVAAHSKGAVTANDVLESWNAPDVVKNAVRQKALIGATNNTDFGEALVDYQNLTSEFIELVRKATAVDKLAPLMREVPFNIKMPKQNSAVSVGWVGETKRKPTTNPTYGSVTLSKSKVAGIVLLSEELVRWSNPKADRLVRDDFVKSTAEFIDADFFDPDKAETELSPASPLNGIAPVISSGETAAQIEADLVKVIKTLTDQGIPLSGAHWVMSETRAATLSVMRDALGKKYFEEMNITGSRSLMTLPVLISKGCDDKIVLILPSEIMIADDEFMDFAVSTEASINMGTDEAPDWLNLFEQDLIAIRAERFIRWKKRQTYAAGYIQY
ncbi:phage major capsid protein [Acinetobacter baumannii]|uniref:phage major capsid protein n=1 Tax=Acinetobacter baumannii TaxID=470 RepID=UPI000DD02DD6|nr:phage major capsid protein [Acinetobacter baumannii]